MTPQTEEYREIPLTQGQVARVSAHRFEELNQWKWFAQWNPSMKSFYAARWGKQINGKRPIILMHRFILGLEYGDPRTGDHKFHDTLDNREFIDGERNLRIADDSEQGCNRRKRSDNTSGFKGVSFHKGKGQYAASIMARGSRRHLGYRPSAEQAYRELYLPAAEELHREFAHGG